MTNRSDVPSLISEVTNRRQRGAGLVPWLFPGSFLMQQIELVGELGVWSERGRAAVWLHASDSYMFLLLYKDPQEGKESHLMKGRGMRGEVSLSLGRGEVGEGYKVFCLLF